MINFNDSIDTNIFFALQVTRKCMEFKEDDQSVDIPNVLLLSNIGVGKSTAVKLFAEINDYDVVLLRISNETPDTITGYDVAPNNTTSGECDDSLADSAKHLRPSWFKKILKNKENGIKSLLFLDELTTAAPQVQGAALNIVFDRKCHEEKLPNDTLVVAAGNYAENLSEEMTVLAPMLNRFIVFNIQPKIKDIDHFLCKYQGSLAGKRIDVFDEIRKSMAALRDMERPLTKDFLNKAGEYIENNLMNELRALHKEGMIDFSVTSIKDIYSDVGEVDSPLSNLATFRTLNYLLDSAVACYKCFGKEGLLSDNFKNIINGTIGLGLTRDPKTREVVRNYLTDRFYMAISDTANDIEKMLSNKLPEYQDFFRTVLGDDKKVFTIGEMNILTNKIKEMISDKEISSIDRPMDEDIVKKMCSTIKNTITKSIANKVSVGHGGNMIEEIAENPEEYIGKIHTWNNLNSLVIEVSSLVNDVDKKYPSEIKVLINDLRTDCRQCSTHLKMTKKGLQRNYPDLMATIPEIL